MRISDGFNQNKVNKKIFPSYHNNIHLGITKIHANGLQNIGANCFMNSTLQCFAHVEDLIKKLLQKKNEIKKNKYKNKTKSVESLAWIPSNKGFILLINSLKL